MMPTLTVPEDLAVAALAAYLGTKGMEPVSMRLYELESAQDRDRENSARPGPPYQSAAQKIAARLGIELQGKALDRAALTMQVDLWVNGREVTPLDLPPSFAGLRDSPLDGSHPGTFAAMSADTMLTSHARRPLPEGSGNGL